MPTPKRRVRQAEIVQLFAARLRETRSSRGMTQAELARQADVTVSYIWKLESGATAPGIDLVDRLARALGTTVAEMLPTAVAPDTLVVLRESAKKLFGELLQAADRETYLMVNPMLARINETLARKR